LPHPQEFTAEDIRVGWPVGDGLILGELARQLGSKTPARLVSSAKSWLSHNMQDAREAFLPLEAPEDVTKLSPQEATTRYLNYLRQAWNAKFPEDPLEQQVITITVPASFDPAARDLTVEAARAQGFEELTLLEEPQAAFYAWLAGQGQSWRDQLQVGDTLLVVVIGGGTSVFSMSAVPAAIDPAARDLTVAAARPQGFEELTLLGEPQAAFYAWWAGQGQSWRDQLQEGDTLLVVDIGGGTSDFSMIAVAEEEGELSL